MNDLNHHSVEIRSWIANSNAIWDVAWAYGYKEGLEWMCEHLLVHLELDRQTLDLLSLPPDS